MPNAAWARAVIFLAAGLWMVLAFTLGVPIDKQWLKYVGVTASAVVLLLLAFDLFIWRWLPLWLTKRPVLRGTWRATIASNWAAGDQRPADIECYIVVHQTYSKICVEMLFEISDSSSTSAEIQRGMGRISLWYTYRSEAHALQQTNNPPHRGAVMLYISTEPKLRLEGDYWTERSTIGRIKTTGHSKKLAGDFSGAQNLEFK